MKSGLCATQLYPKSDTSSYSNNVCHNLYAIGSVGRSVAVTEHLVEVGTGDMDEEDNDMVISFLNLFALFSHIVHFVNPLHLFHLVHLLFD